MILLVVLVLVLAAFALLITALATGTMLWAWGSVALSAVGALVLVADWLVRRRRRAAAEPDETGQATAIEPPLGAQSAPVAAKPDSDTDDESDAELDQDTEPGEEDTDAADLLAVTDLDAPVVVLDERPRYHLADCRWLGDRPPLDLPVREARELGFTPCAVCTPDRVLAARHRRAGAT